MHAPRALGTSVFSGLPLSDEGSQRMHILVVKAKLLTVCNSESGGIKYQLV